MVVQLWCVPLHDPTPFGQLTAWYNMPGGYSIIHFSKLLLGNDEVKKRLHCPYHIVSNVSRSERGRQSAGQIPGAGGKESAKWPKEQEKGTSTAWRAACWIESQPSETSCCEGREKDVLQVVLMLDVRVGVQD